MIHSGRHRASAPTNGGRSPPCTGPDSRQRVWYQQTFPGQKDPSELPGFVHGDVFLKGLALATARMETPVIYFYTDEKIKIDVSVDFPGGRITEVYPRFRGQQNQWKGVELIPPGDSELELPIDEKRPDNHYYEARAVPGAAYVRLPDETNSEGLELPEEVEKFIFYRGTGSFDDSLRITMNRYDTIEIVNYDTGWTTEHAWAVLREDNVLRWQKLPPLPRWDRDHQQNPTKTTINLSKLDAFDSVEASAEALTGSMVEALIDAGLTPDEAAAMIATWDEQWYEEEGQRVFSISSPALIDQILPLEIEPEPEELKRVFVHRAEIISPQTVSELEAAMAEGVDKADTREVIVGAKLGRFAFGAVSAVAEDVGNRIANEYRMRGMKALQPLPVTAPAEDPTVSSVSD